MQCNRFKWCGFFIDVTMCDTVHDVRAIFQLNCYNHLEWYLFCNIRDAKITTKCDVNDLQVGLL